MVCHDDHLLRRGEGFPPHDHADLTIVTWVISGALEHDGPTGPARVEPGQVAVLRTGSAVTHSEVAAAPQTRFVQVWLTPAGPEEPSYEVATPELPRGRAGPRRRTRAGRRVLGGPARRPSDRHHPRRTAHPRLRRPRRAAPLLARRAAARGRRVPVHRRTGHRPDRRCPERAAGLVVRLAASSPGPARGASRTGWPPRGW